MASKRTIGLVLALVVLTGLSQAGPGLDPKLAPLEPLLHKDWRGMLKAPDGSAAWETACRFEPVWAGKVIKYTRTTPERDSVEEGYIYWDDPAQMLAFFSIQSGGVFSTGFVSIDQKLITIRGRMTWPAPPPNPGVKQSYDFRNTFELLSESEMVDRWFQNAFGPWRPGHVITFREAKSD
jgi:hypothetical protein